MADFEFTFEKYDGTPHSFIEKALFLFETNAIYRGYEELLSYVKSIDIKNYDLYQGSFNSTPGALAAVKYANRTLFFDIFIVEEQFRGIGLGDEMFSWIANQYEDADSYESFALPGDRNTKNFFEQHKGKARLLTVRGELN